MGFILPALALGFFAWGRGAGLDFENYIIVAPAPPAKPATITLTTSMRIPSQLTFNFILAEIELIDNVNITSLCIVVVAISH